MNHETDKHGGSMEFFASEIQFFGGEIMWSGLSGDVVAIWYEFWIDYRNFKTKWDTRRFELGMASRIHETEKDGGPVEFGTFVHNK